MTAKHLLLRTQAQEKVLHEVSQLADAVRVTLGPTARAILVERKWGRPLVSDDGVTIAKAFVKEAKGTETPLEVMEGIRFDQGYLSPYFATDAERMECVLQEAMVLLYGKRISSLEALVPVQVTLTEGGSKKDEERAPLPE